MVRQERTIAVPPQLSATSLIPTSGQPRTVTVPSRAVIGPMTSNWSRAGKSAAPGLALTVAQRPGAKDFAHHACQIRLPVGLGEQGDTRVEATAMHDGGLWISRRVEYLHARPPPHDGVGEFASGHAARHDHVSE